MLSTHMSFFVQTVVFFTHYKMADVRHSEKDSGNESEPELSSCDFSKLNISPKPIHTRPSAVRIMSKKSALAQQLEREDSAQTTGTV